MTITQPITKNMFAILIEFILYLIAIGLLSLPLLLALAYPEHAEYFVKFSEAMVPWVAVLIICGMLKEVFRHVARKAVEFIGRISKISAAGTDVHFRQGTNENMFPDSKDMHEKMKQLIASQQEWSNVATLFFEKYVSVTIFGSQFKLLLELEKGQLAVEQILPFYRQFWEAIPEGKEKIPFENWLAYLTSNLLVLFDDKTKRYCITTGGLHFVRRAREARMEASSFLY